MIDFAATIAATRALAARIRAREAMEQINTRRLLVQVRSSRERLAGAVALLSTDQQNEWRAACDELEAACTEERSR